MPQGGETPGFERSPQQPERALETPIEGASFEMPAAGVAERPAEPVSVPAPVPVASAQSVQKDMPMRQVEQVLEEGLSDVYHKMNPRLQRKFREQGDRVARTIAAMVRRAKVGAREVLALISKWLRIIPGVNAFFLAQEAK